MMTTMLQAIKERRSVREFTDEPLSEIDIITIIESGIWAPSTNNHQPWRFVIVQDAVVRALIAELTVYSTIVANCQSMVAIYIDNTVVRDRLQDQQSVGAVIQNMLLTADSLGVGAVWLGQVLEKSEKVSAELGIDNKYELSALVALGYPAHGNQKSHRQNVSDFILKNIGG